MSLGFRRILHYLKSSDKKKSATIIHFANTIEKIIVFGLRPECNIRSVHFDHNTNILSANYHNEKQKYEISSYDVIFS